MAKTTGPLLSLTAAGTLANALTYRRTRRSTATYAKPTPNNPNSGNQQAIRLMVKFLSQQWPAIGPTNQATWKPENNDAAPTAYHNYMSINLQRWTSGNYPAQSRANMKTGVQKITSLFTTVGGRRHVDITYRSNQTGDAPWAAIFTSALINPFNFIWNQTKLIEPISHGPTYKFTDAPVPAGVPFYGVFGFTVTGLASNSFSTNSVVVT